MISVEHVYWRDVAGGNIVELTQWMRVNYDKGSIQFFPNTGTLAAIPIHLTQGGSFPLGNILVARGRYPDAFYIDYTVGFEDVKKLRAKWPELIQVVGQLAAINMLNDYGDGRSPGLASSSVSLAGISESFSTTQSATNALFGARILQFEKQLKEFYKKNKNRYCGIQLAAL